MIEANETFEGTWPFAPRFHQIAADGGAAPFRLHFCQEDAPDVLVALIEQFVQSS